MFGISLQFIKKVTKRVQSFHISPTQFPDAHIPAGILLLFFFFVLLYLHIYFNAFIYIYRNINIPNIYSWLCWVFIAALKLSLVVASGVTLQLWHTGPSHCGGFSYCRAQASAVAAHTLQRAGSLTVAPRLSCSKTCGIFPEQGWNPCPLHWQVDSSPLQGSLRLALLSQYNACGTHPDCCVLYSVLWVDRSLSSLLLNEGPMYCF